MISGIMSAPSDYDEQQDDQALLQREMLLKFNDWLKAQGGPDLTPTEWEELDEPVPFSDVAVFPTYVYAGHLVDDGGQGKLRCVCHGYPRAPFNPYWGVENHEFERIGLEKYNPEIHDEWIFSFGETTKAERLERISELRQ